MPDSNTISVIIPTWNRCDLVVTCLQSLQQQTHPDVEIIVVDDGSSDDTVKTLQQDFPNVIIESMQVNSGFAKATNAGIRKATGDWILLLNNDVTLEPDCLEKMLQTAHQTGAEMIAPLIFWQDDPKTLYSAGDRIRINGRPEAIGFRKPRDKYPFPETIFGVTAAAGLYKKELFEAVGLLDETFVAYFEDSDLCFRARLAGVDAALARDAHAFHIGSATLQGNTWWRSAQCFQNHALLVLKNMPASLLLRHGPHIYREHLHQAGMLFSAARAEAGALNALRTLMEYSVNILRRLPHALCQRRQIQRHRVISVRALRRLLTKGSGHD